MKSKMLLSLAMASMSLIFATGCSQTDTKKKQADSKAQESNPLKVVGAKYTTILFEKGRSSLSSFHKKNLKTLAQEAKASDRPIKEIKILAWADQEYPEENETKASTDEIILASERNRKIRDFIESDLQIKGDIDSFNMAKRPNVVSKFLKNEEYQLKNTMEDSGPTASKLPDGSISYTKASKALVIISYEGDEAI